MIRRDCNRTHGFTLVELLVVIAIITALIGIVMPTLIRVRLQANRVADLSQIRQIGIACISYASENKGYWPLGSRLGNDTITPTDNDDVQWLNTWTFAYFLGFSTSRSIADRWLVAPTGPYPNLPAMNRQPLACTTISQTPDNGMYICVGINKFRYDPAGVGFYQSFMGYAYWGGRPPRVTGDLFDESGHTVAPASQFQFPQKQSGHSTSDVLLSCDAYANNVFGEQLPHYGFGDLFWVGSAPTTTPGDGRTGPTARMNGLCCAYTDGSAAWVSRKALCSVSGGGSNWYFFDGSRMH